MNVGLILNSVYDTLGYKNTPDSSITRRMLGYMNMSYREVLTKKQMVKLRRAPLTFSSVANSPFAVLPQASVRILAICDRTTNRLLEPLQLSQIRARDPGLNFSSSIPYGYCPLNLGAAVARDPSAAASIFVISDQAADGAAISCSIEGTITGGFYRYATVALNGTAPVNLSAVISTWEHITKFYLSGPASGNVTITEGSGGTELARIVPGRSYARYSQIHFAGTPATVATYYADVELHIQDMISMTDEPIWEEDFHDILEAGCLRFEFRRREKLQAWQLEQARFNARVADLQDFISRPSGASGGGARGRRQEGPQLAGGYW